MFNKVVCFLPTASKNESYAAGLSVTPMLGTRNNASCPTPTLRGSPGRESPEFAEHGIDTARKTLLRFLYLTCFLQGVSCGILEPFCQNAVM
ncbi:hypothetical protein V5799_023030 [Amblyomma americanum]|uniref:Uncharacterized protein n=1 Tax=Amblyomma americanum TaxID=6943 RepID=A0AAQ4FKB9_AMBAM